MRARLDTCADNIMSVNVYKLVCRCLLPAANYKLECTPLRPNLLDLAHLLVVHPGTQCLKEVTFHITSHEDSVVLSCGITLKWSLVQPHNNLDSFHLVSNLIISKADYPGKKKVPEKCKCIKAKSESVFKQGTIFYKWCLHMAIKLISVMYKNIKIKQASGSV